MLQLANSRKVSIEKIELGFRNDGKFSRKIFSRKWHWRFINQDQLSYQPLWRFKGSISC